MVRFAHISDSHLGGWKQAPMQELNFKAFKLAIDVIIKEKPEFVVIAGDLFDSAYPPIEILKETFSEFKRLKEARIPCFIIAGSHDSSVSGKTFLDVLEKAGFCKNVANFEDNGKEIILLPVVYQGVAFYGYPGKKSGLEVPDIKRIRIQDSPGLFRIFLLHTTIDKVKGSLPIDSVEYDSLPEADYYALGHIHIDFQYDKMVYPGPIFPNNFKELEDLGSGGFYIVNTESKDPLKRINLEIKKIISIEMEIDDATIGTDKIISELEKNDLRDKIVLLRVNGRINSGNISDIKFGKIEEFAKSKGAYFILRNTHDLKTEEAIFELELDDPEMIEEQTLKSYSDSNPSHFNQLISPLMNILSNEKNEDERNETFENRIIDESKKILKF